MNATITAKQAAKLTVSQLIDMDIEFADRAIKLGRPGVVSKTHKIVRDALNEKLG